MLSKIFKAISGFFKIRDEHYHLYSKAVGRARQEFYYTELGVEDSLEGRFDLIILQLFLVTNRISIELGGKHEMIQGLQEALVCDMDRSLREMGVGDMRVGKQVKSMAVAWLGRATAYTQAIAEENDDMLIECLSRNLYSMEDGTHDMAPGMAKHVRDMIDALLQIRVDDILTSNYDYPAFK